MPKKYEDEIRDILKGMDRFPGDSPGTTRKAPRPGLPRFGGVGGGLQLDPQRLMGGALILILVSWIMQGPWSSGSLLRMAGYVSLAGTALFVVALILFLRRRGTFGAPGMSMGGTEKRWRGQVINFPNRQPFWRRWYVNLARRLNRSPRGPSRPSPRGRDSSQW